MKTMKFKARRHHSGPTEVVSVYTDDLSKVPALEAGFSEWEAVGASEMPDAAMAIAVRKTGYAMVVYG